MHSQAGRNRDDAELNENRQLNVRKARDWRATVEEGIAG